MKYHTLIVAAVALVFAGCGGSQDHGQKPAKKAQDGQPTVGPALVGSVCTPAPVRHHNVPSWARIPGVPDSSRFPYVIASGSRVAGFLFLYPLRAHLPPGTYNKILWAVGTDPKPKLHITAWRPRHAGAVLHVPADAGAGNGQIQRTTLRFPKPGCWRFSLRWGSQRATVDLKVGP